MRRHRLMSREEVLLRETVRRLIAETEDAEQTEVVPSGPAKFTEWLMSMGPAYATGVDESNGLSFVLSLIETAADAGGVALNYFDNAPGWAGALLKAANLQLDFIGIVNSTVQFSVACDIVRRAEKHRSEFDPARADEIIRSYKLAQYWSFAMVVLSFAAAGASIGEIMGNQSAGLAEAAFKAVKKLDEIVKIAQYANLGVEELKSAIDRLAASADVFLRNNPNVVQTIDTSLSMIEKHPLASKILMDSLFQSSGATGVNMSIIGMGSPSNDIIAYVPTFRKEMRRQGYI